MEVQRIDWIPTAAGYAFTYHSPFDSSLYRPRPARLLGITRHHYRQ